MVLHVAGHQRKTPSSEIEVLLDEDPLPAARALIARAAQHDGGPPISDQAMIEAAQGKRELTLFSEVRGLRAPVAVAIVGSGELDLVVDPAARGRGVGTAALRAVLADRRGSEVRAWSHGPGHSEQRNALRAVYPDPALGIGSGNPAADALLAHAGFAPVRTLLLMELDPSLLPSEPPQRLPELLEDGGFALRAFDPDSPSDAAAWVRVNAAAFAAHPEQGRITEADFAAMRREPWFDADDLILLDGRGGLAGSTWIKTVPDPAGGGPETELYAIGVDPAYAGRGLGKLLLDATLARMAQHRPARVSLYVDGDNEHAVRMYEAAGFTIAARSRQWSSSAVHPADNS